MSDFPLKIFDDLYGLVHFNKAEKEIINSPYFQRLRRIKQLGLANLVFPGAEHTRFSHSIGVLWIIDRICRHLKLNKHFGEKEINHLRMAALLHDIGHFPLSHTIEEVYDSFEKKKQYEQVSRIIKGKEKHYQQTLNLESGKNKPALHERIGQKIIEDTDIKDGITKILKENKYEPQKIGAIILGQSENFLFNQLIHSDLDADQMDYLIRDAKNTGSKYGQYEVDYLIECMHLEKKGNDLILCIKEKGIHTLEHYILAKYFYYTNILYHRTRTIFEKIGGKIFSELIEKKKFNLPTYEDLTSKFYKNPQEFLYFDDFYFYNILKQIITDRNSDIKLKKLAKIILLRKKPKTKFEVILNLKQGKNIKILKDAKREAKKIEKETKSILKEAGLCRLEESIKVFKSYEERIKEVDISEDEFRYRDRDSIKILTSKRNPNKNEIVLLNKNLSTIISQIEGVTTYFIRVYS